jgi:hypothetical protein
MKTRFEPRLPRMSWKNIHTLDMNSGPLHHKKVILSLDHQSKIPQINISSIQNYLGLSFLPVWQICSFNWVFTSTALWGLYVSGFDGPMSKTYYWCKGFESWVWNLLFFHADILRRLGSNLVSIVFLGLHMWNLELRYGKFFLESCNPNLN